LVAFLVVLMMTSVMWGQLPALELPGLEKQPEGKHVEIEVAAQYEEVAAGQKFALAVVLEVEEGWHLYANPKRGELGLDTEIIPQESESLRFGKVVYSEGEKYEDKILQSTNYIYEGKVVCYVPVQIAAGEPAEVPVALELKGLLCSDKGTCLPWEDKVTTTVKISNAATESPVMNRPELFAGLDLEAIKWEGAVSTTDSVPVSVSPAQRGDGEYVIPDYQPREFTGEAITAGDWMRPLLLALVAGFLLNVMPCVLPVIPLKVLSLIQQSQRDIEQGDRLKPIKLALVFSLGIILVFVALAVVMSVFKILYGQQFQSDAFKFIMLMIIYVMALSMLGLFEVVLPGKVSNIAVVREGYLGALGMGVLATLLATPCSAPLLSPVLTWSLSKPTVITVAVFIVVGIGMAAPYVVLTAFPKLLHRLPKAGPWMNRLKQGLGFVMLAVCLYLIFLFSVNWHLPLMVFCLMLAFAIWLGMRVVDYSSPPAKKWITRCISILIIVAGSMVLTNWTTGGTESEAEYWLDALLAAHKQGETAMVEFTADWCPNCRAVEIAVLKKQAFKDKLKETGTKLIIADWTYNDPAITEMLERLGSKSIPFAAIFPGKNPLQPIVLRDIYGLNTALDALEAAKKIKD
jgi:thiol:disulfide interchange protein DsbD